MSSVEPRDPSPDPERPGSRTLADLVRAEAPVATRRAAAVLLTVARSLERRPGTVGPSGVLPAGDVVLHGDGTVALPPVVRLPADDPSVSSAAATPSTAAGSAVGRLLFELLVGRPPLGREDALEPAPRSALAPPDVALLARSCSDAEGQWPELAEWTHTLAALAGGQATDPTPAELSAALRRRVLLTLGLALLVVATLVVVLLAPGWWDAANAPT